MTKLPLHPSAEPASIHSIEKAFARGEEQALRAAYKQHGNLIFTYCRRTLNEDRTNDVTQEVFISAWKIRHRFDPAKGTLVGWRFSITRNRIIDNVRAERRHSERRANLDLIELPTETEIEFKDGIQTERRSEDSRDAA